MKKKFVAFSVLAVLLLSVLSACSCSNTPLLAFSSGFAGDGAPSGGYSQTITYKVEYKTDEDGYRRDEKFPSDKIQLEYGEGVAEYSLKVGSGYYGIETDIKDIGETFASSKVYKLDFSFTIPLKITVDGKTADSEEKITSKTYFLPSDLSFAPLYSLTESEYYVVSLGDNAAAASKLKQRNEIVYNKEEYTVKTQNEYLGFLPESEEIKEDTKVATCDYSFRKVIDNAQLLFAVRGMTIEAEKSITADVVSYLFNDPQTLSFSNVRQAEITIPVSYNGAAAKDATFKYDEIEFRISSLTAAGTAQKVFVQSAAAGDIPNLKLPIMYIQPLQSMGGNFATYGCLKFTLKEVEINA